MSTGISTLTVRDTGISQPLGHFGHAKIKMKEIEPICRVLEPRSDYCEIKGNIRIQGNSSTIFIASSHMSNSEGNSSWRIRPYARKENAAAMEFVRKWTIKLVAGHEDIPNCTQHHRIPAILFSLGGFSGNHFHDFTDLVIPLYLTSRQFNGEVSFLTTDYRPWWITKFQGILDGLSRHEIVNIDREEEIHCYPSVIVGLKCHKELSIDPSISLNRLSMKDFRQFLRSSYSLKRTTAIKMRKGEHKRPNLMIISRRGSRLLMNEGKISKMARRLGFDVIVADASLSTNLSRFAQIVNSCDVMMGVHGAGLANMVFLPENAILIQVVPLGGIDEPARKDFGEPAIDMNIRYLEYKIRVQESSLIQLYPLDHAVLRDPLSFHKQGWDAIKNTYLEKQNVRIDVRRFRTALLKALKLLHH
ncbi:hypothetical protein F0562_023908 [Nyssa sinensis]|uniref:Glycosyltransferase 61 catalytic domain-containing protein n=1 Tax=Nyssa sinensis TaxID=561372 RepID=A0A5J5BJB7_9ASTE|nr:hypothetical protein F0562_023908 [Nyssa sinensis]